MLRLTFPHANDALNIRAAGVRVCVEAVSRPKAYSLNDIAHRASKALGWLLGRDDGCGDGGDREEAGLHAWPDWGRDW